jgi:hypothetical protein
VIWLWHALFDGTRLCRCEHSRRYRAYLRDAEVRRRGEAFRKERL